jgi:hypothetical protein
LVDIWMLSSRQKCVFFSDRTKRVTITDVTLKHNQINSMGVNWRRNLTQQLACCTTHQLQAIICKKKTTMTYSPCRYFIPG